MANKDYFISTEGKLGQRELLFENDFSFLGDLNPEGFDMLDSWVVYEQPGPVDLACRFGFKQDVPYPSGGRGVVLCYFAVGLPKTHGPVTAQEQGELECILDKTVRGVESKLVNKFKKVLSVKMEPLPYMLDELTMLLKEAYRFGSSPGAGTETR